ncbi:hypothetical protein Tco_0598941 [Tanacetum coccineum]
MCRRLSLSLVDEHVIKQVAAGKLEKPHLSSEHTSDVLISHLYDSITIYGSSNQEDIMPLTQLKYRYMKSHENRQKRASTDTRTEECTKAGSQSQKKSNLQSTPVNLGQQKSTIKDKIQNIPL